MASAAAQLGFSLLGCAVGRLGKSKLFGAADSAVARALAGAISSTVFVVALLALARKARFAKSHQHPHTERPLRARFERRALGSVIRHLASATLVPDNTVRLQPGLKSHASRHDRG